MEKLTLRDLSKELGYYEPHCKLILELEIENISPLHIGCGKGTEFRDPTLRIYAFRDNKLREEFAIPETELKGCLRSIIEKYINKSIADIVKKFLSNLGPDTSLGRALNNIVKEIHSRLLTQVSHEDIRRIVINSIAYTVQFTHTQFGHTLLRTILHEKGETLFEVEKIAGIEFKLALETVKQLLYGTLSHHVEELLSQEVEGVLLNVGIRILWLITVSLYYENIIKLRQRVPDPRECLRETYIACVRLCELLCPVCRLFGGSTISDRIVLTTLRQVPQELSTRHIVHTSISRYTGTVESHRLFSVEILEPGVKFQGQLILQLPIDKILDGAHKPYLLLDTIPLLYLLKQLTEENLHIGKYKSTGYGICKVKITQSKIIKIKENLKIEYKNIDIEELKKKLEQLTDKLQHTH